MPRTTPPHWWLVVLATAGWSAGHLVGHGALALVLPCVVAVGCAVLWRTPVLACLLVCGAQTTALLSDIPVTSPAGLAPALLCLTVLGLSTRPRAGLPLVALFLAIVVATGLPLGRTVVGLVLFTGVWALATQTRRRRARVVAQRRRAAELAAQDAREVADRVVARERQLLLARSARVVRTALADVRDAAAQAGRHLDRPRVEQVRERAAAAIDELRELLDLVTETEEEPPPDPTAGVRRRRLPPRLRTLAQDGATAVGVLLVGLVDLHVDDIGPTGPRVALTVTLAAALVLRRTAPAPATCVAALAMVAATVLGAHLSHGIAEAVTLALLSWTTHARGGRLATACWAGLLVAVVAAAQPRGAGYPEVAGALVVAAAVGARLTRRSVTDQRQVAARVAELETTADAVVREALEAGRCRLAQDLHDVVGHALGVMVMQAGAAAVACERDPDRARQALAQVAGTGDDALGELDALAAGGEATPESLVAGLAAMVERIRSAGVELDVSTPAELPGGPVAGVLHRVVQESLTNAVKHAPGAGIRLVVRCAGDDVTVEVSNGPSAAALRGPGTRRGLAGLADRVRSAGGRFESGRLADGGFRIRAALPWHPLTAEQPVSGSAGRERVG